MNWKTTLFQKISLTFLASILLLFAMCIPATAANSYSSGTMQIDTFTTGSLSTDITATHSTLIDITTLTIVDGTISSTDMYWIRDNLISLETFRVIENGRFTNDTLPDTALYTNGIDNGHGNITYLDLPTITAVSDNASMDCYNLEYLNIPNVTSVGTQGFYGCSNLSTIIAPNIETLNSSAFQNTNITILDWEKLTTIDGDSTFAGCNNLATVDLPNVTSVGQYMFADCDNLTSVNMPNAITVSYGAFENNDGIVNITLPNVTSVDVRGFYNARNLVNITLPKAETIEDIGFSTCVNLTEISLPNVTYVGRQAFRSTNITELYMPNLVIVDIDAFLLCTNLISADLPNAETIDTGAFAYCGKLTTINMPNVTYVGSNAFNDVNITELYMPNVVTVDIQAFSSCANLISVDLPNLSSLGEKAFENCYALASFSSQNLTVIGNNDPFRHCSNLATVNTPNLITIGNSAFGGDTKLTTITSDNVTTIDFAAFAFCSNITSISLPNVTDIGAYAFYKCEQLETMILGSTVPTVDNSDLMSFSNLPENRTLYVPAENVSDYKAYEDDDGNGTDLWYGWTVTAIPVEEEPEDDDDDSSSTSSGDSGGVSSVGSGYDSDIVDSTTTRTIRIYAGNSVNYDFSEGNDVVVGVSFDALQSKGTVVGRVQELTEEPEDIPTPDGSSYGIISINIGSTGTITSNSADDLVIHFKVSKEWIEEGNIDVSTIRMTRYHGEQWNDLPTYQESEDDGYIYFYAETPGFSVFEVIGDTISAISEESVQASAGSSEPVEEDVTTGKDDSDNSSLVIFALVAIVLVAGIGYFIWNKQNNGGEQ